VNQAVTVKWQISDGHKGSSISLVTDAVNLKDSTYAIIINGKVLSGGTYVTENTSVS